MRRFGSGRLAGEGTIGSHDAWTIAFDVHQSSADPFASGSLRLRGPDGDWTASAFGILQTAPGWATVSAMLVDALGRTRSAILVAEMQSPGAAGSRRIVVSFDDATLAGDTRQLALEMPN
jgi:hypothetical protein